MPVPLPHLLRLAPRSAEPADADLLDAFARQRDETAFAELVRRHGPVVYRACRRVVGRTAADDAFRATSLVLATRTAAAHPSRSRSTGGGDSYPGGLSHAGRAVAGQPARATAREMREPRDGPPGSRISLTLNHHFFGNCGSASTFAYRVGSASNRFLAASFQKYTFTPMYVVDGSFDDTRLSV